ncbi:hypothetical protein CMQ_3730 [Grosmannia clavigera kw1407]|uniref:PH domain-containing protein n=1 Tax=Grosmannia clavigera (strain kw1407 / UAMH 11150) TaxID=655863 RepID=F0XAK4_GROCL|nr:uncharacterized protein CMQ_3730 [Grosmannia clavigera kw1407]EFX05661.1 hypothetical protein CMQ_3730 [Grosmannia clavigera kw1407]
MAEEQKPVEVPAVEAPAVEPVVAEATPAVEVVAETPAAAEPVVEAAAVPVEAAVEEPAAEAAAAPAEEVKEEVKPIEEGVLEAKGTSFPKKFLYTKKFFWFGNDALSAKDLAAYVKSEKATDVAHHVISWASETGKGLLLYGEKPGDKSTAHGVIQLADASEPTAEGTHKFQLTSKGHKHIFKASSTAERDNWVNQIKAKITEAKELAATVAESEAYKNTLASLKPAKKETPKEAPKEEKKEEAAAPVEADAPAETEAETAEPAAAVEEAPKEAPKEEEKKEKKEEKGRRSASRKRASIFGNFIGKKDDKKEVTEPEVVKEDDEEAVAPAEAVAEEAAAAPAAEAPVVDVEAAAEAAAPEVKSPSAKRASIFGNLGFSKKKVEQDNAPAPPAKDVPADAAVSESAPVIPAVETSEPLSTDVSAPIVESPAEAAAEAAPVSDSETKKEVKSDKRKSTLPFNFGSKKDKSDDEGEKKSSPFSKFRATVRLNRKEKTPAKAEETVEEAAAPAEVEAEAAAETEAPVEEAAAAPAEAAEAVPATIAEEAAEKPSVVAATPQVAATA